MIPQKMNKICFLMFRSSAIHMERGQMQTIFCYTPDPPTMSSTLPPQFLQRVGRKQPSKNTLAPLDSSAKIFVRFLASTTYYRIGSKQCFTSALRISDRHLYIYWVIVRFMLCWVIDSDIYFRTLYATIDSKVQADSGRQCRKL